VTEVADPSGAGQKILRQLEDVGAALPQRRHVRVDAAQPIVEIGPKELPADQIGQ
jgi:hypothetical protein